MKRNTVLFLLFSLMFVTAFGQSKQYNRQQKNTFEDADSYYVYGDYYTASKLFLEIYDVDPDFREINYKLGDALFQLDEFDEALPYLEKGIGFNLDAHYQVAQIHLYQGNLQACREVIEDFKNIIEPKKSQYNFQDLNRLLEKTQVAERMMLNPEVVNIINLGKKVNSKNDEYVPLIASDESVMIFTSRRLREGNELDPSGQPFEDIYISMHVDGEWTKAKPIPGDVNTDVHDACVGLSPDGERLFVYRSNDNLIGGDIYESFNKDGLWTTPVRMGEEINNYETIEPSASLSLDGKTFYFSSNREGGFGGFDLYRVKLLPNGEWSKAKNLGPTINTPYDDDAPFIHPNGKTLYFSSKGHKNMGGFDVFKSELQEEEKWSEPENLGYPTNTTKDDIYFVISANEQHGYYASDKSGGFGEHDLYMIDYLEKELRQSVIRGKVVDAKSGKAIQSDISLIELESGELSGAYRTNQQTGSFIFLVNPNVEYDLIIEANGYQELMEPILYQVEDLQKEQNKTFKLKPTPSEP
ncbi:MAG: hypothetical protein RIC95_11255 [Vicingaceae bacterium]